MALANLFYGNNSDSGSGNPVQQAQPWGQIAPLQQQMFSNVGGFQPGQGQINLPTTVNNRAPTYDMNTQYGVDAANAGGAMSGGWKNNGIKAFLPGDLNQLDFSNWNNKSDNSGMDSNERIAGEFDGMRQLRDNVLGVAGRMGYDLSGYDTNNLGVWGATKGGRNSSYADELTHNAYTAAGKPSPYDTQPGQQRSFNDLYDDMNRDLSDFSRVRSASAGWDGKNNPRGTAEAMYQQTSPGVWQPVSDPKFGVKAEHKGWAREDGAETIAALSTIMPMFTGGFGAAGAFGSLGTYGNMAANAAMGALKGGTGGLLGSLGSSLGGLGGGALGSAINPAYSQLGSQIGSLAGRSLATGTAPGMGQLAGLFRPGSNGQSSLSSLFGGGG